MINIIKNLLNNFKNEIITTIKENQATNKKKTYSEEEKAYSLKMKKLREEAKLYEEFVCNYYIDKDYEAIHHGKKGKKDKGIDVIAKKENEIILIQTKNLLTWEQLNTFNQKKTNVDIKLLNKLF